MAARISQLEEEGAQRKTGDNQNRERRQRRENKRNQTTQRREGIHRHTHIYITDTNTPQSNNK